MATTKLADLINPLVIGAFMHKTFIERLVFGQFADISRDLEGRPGDTKMYPSWNYIGDATTVAEGEQIPTLKLSKNEMSVKVKKVAQAVELTDEAVLSGYQEPLNQAVLQIAISIANAVEDDFVKSIKALSPSTVEIDKGYHWVLDAQVAFGEDFSEDNFLFISPARRAVILKSPDFVVIQQGGAVVKGHIGQIFGTNVIITSRLGKDEAVMLRRGGLGLEMKRDYRFEEERLGSFRKSILSADQYYATFVKDAAKVVYINKVKVGP